jgi:hypothetical protein
VPYGTGVEARWWRVCGLVLRVVYRPVS